MAKLGQSQAHIICKSSWNQKEKCLTQTFEETERRPPAFALSLSLVKQTQWFKLPGVYTQTLSHKHIVELVKL